MEALWARRVCIRRWEQHGAGLGQGFSCSSAMDMDLLL